MPSAAVSADKRPTKENIMLTRRWGKRLLTPALIALAAACLSAPAAAAPPENDAFSAAIELSGRQALVSATNKDATKEDGEPNHADKEGGTSVWYRWTAPAGGLAILSTCGSGFDTLLAAYTGTSVDTLTGTEVAANDDACGLQSSIEFPAVEGTTYRIVVDGLKGAIGAYDLELVLRPVNDDFAKATVLTGDAGTVAGTNEGASREANEPEGLTSSVWYRWTAPSSGPATFETCGSAFDTTLYAFAGSQLADLTLLAADDDTCETASRVHFDATAGTTYAIAVDGFTGEQGDISLTWNRNPPPPEPPFALDYPSISGLAREDETLTGSDGVWGGAQPISLGRTWWRCDANFDTCERIPGAVSQTYTLSARDVGYHVFLQVTATNVAGSSDAFSDSTSLVRSRGPANIGAPLLNGIARVDEFLTGSPGNWTGRAPITYAFQWQACDTAGSACRDLAGQVSSVLIVDRQHVGQRLRLVVTASNADGARAAASAPSDVVLPAATPPPVRRCIVPRLKGKTAAAAQRAIRRSGCATGTIRRGYSGSVRRGRVISQTPRPGVRLRYRAKVNFVLSRGRRR
jgi:PASTA domain